MQDCSKFYTNVTTSRIELVAQQLRKLKCISRLLAGNSDFKMFGGEGSRRLVPLIGPGTRTVHERVNYEPWQSPCNSV